MKSDQIYCILDYETYSEADLKKVGAWEYSVHPSTEILCAAWRTGTRETLKTAKTEWWSPHLKSDNSSLIQALKNERVVVTAHNAIFEQVITANVLGFSIPPKRWLCTASLASALALPRNLAGAGQALRLPVQKDVTAHKLMLKMSKPKKATKYKAQSRHLDLEDLKALVKYCVTDTDTEVELFLRCPPLTPLERQVWELDQKINLRGFKVDRDLIGVVLRMISEETEIVNKKTSALSFGVLDSATQRDGVLKFLEAENVSLPNLQKKTVEDAISSGLVTGAAKEMLEYRLSISKTSTAKYIAFEQRSRFDGRIRDHLMYHAASTGRWGGAGVQPQNLPRPTIKDTDLAANVLMDGDLELVRMIYGDPMSAFSSCIRSAIVASPGHYLDVADYNAIEARVLFWVADHKEGLKAFEEGRDLYREQASKVFNVDYLSVTPAQRFVGKQLILACGYQMGAPKFRESCRAQGQEIEESLAQKAVETYRHTNRKVVELWSNLSKAVMYAITNPGKTVRINKTAWYVKNGFLFCELPSGRRLAYYGPTIRYETTTWFTVDNEGNQVYGKRPVICHWGIDSYTKKWVNQKTYGGKLTENVVQAIARDLMAEAMLRIDSAGWDIVLSVHDELLGESKDTSKTNQNFCDLMAELPPWAKGLPVRVEGWRGVRYRK